MLLAMYLMFFVAGFPVFTVTGSFIADWHIGYLARTGGEAKYPQFVREAVRSQRRQHTQYLSRPESDD